MGGFRRWSGQNKLIRPIRRTDKRTKWFSPFQAPTLYSHWSLKRGKPFGPFVRTANRANQFILTRPSPETAHLSATGARIPTLPGYSNGADSLANFNQYSKE